MRVFLEIGRGCTAALLALTGVFGSAAAEVTAIRGATVLTVTQGAIEDGTVIVRDGKIEAIGKNLAIPDGAKIIEARKRFLVPGFINLDARPGAPPSASPATGGSKAAAASSLAVDAAVSRAAVSIEQGEPTRGDGEERSRGVPFTNAADSIWFEDPVFRRAVAGGTTSVQVLPVRLGDLGGEPAVLKLRIGSGREGMLVGGAPRGIVLPIGESGSGAAEPPTRSGAAQSLTPSGAVHPTDRFRKAMAASTEYRLSLERYEARRKAGDKSAKPPAKQTVDELDGVFEGTVPVTVRVSSSDGILHALDIAKTCGFRIATILPGLEARKVADAIKAAGAGVATLSDPGGAGETTPENAALLMRRGIPVALVSDAADLIPHPNLEAAKQIRYAGSGAGAGSGALGRDGALALVTINPARMIGMDGRIGSIEAGKDADLVLFDRDPMSIYSRVEMTMIGGRIVYDGARDYERFVAPAQPGPNAPAETPGKQVTPGIPGTKASLTAPVREPSPVEPASALDRQSDAVIAARETGR